MTTQLDRIDERLERLVAATGQLVEGMAELKEITRQQAQTAERQQQSIERLSLSTERLALAFTGQARDIVDLRAATSQLVETTRVVAQNGETSQYLSQRTLEAIRDLIDEMRQGR